MRTWAFAVAAVLFLFSGVSVVIPLSTAPVNQTIQVCSAVTGNPTCTQANFGALGGANVTMKDSSGTLTLAVAMTDNNGIAQFSLPTTVGYTVVVAAAGYHTATVLYSTGASSLSVYLGYQNPTSTLFFYERGLAAGQRFCVTISPADSNGNTQKCRNYDYVPFFVTQGLTYTVTFSCSSASCSGVAVYPSAATTSVSSGLVTQTPMAPTGHTGADFGTVTTTTTSATTVTSTVFSTVTSTVTLTGSTTTLTYTTTYTTTVTGQGHISNSALITGVLLIAALVFTGIGFTGTAKKRR